jgi:hypothetical protein
MIMEANIQVNSDRPFRSNLKDLTGQRFGRLVVLKPSPRTVGKHHYWECRCDCGNTIMAIGNNLRRGVTRSCGCLRSEVKTRYWENYRKN